MLKLNKPIYEKTAAYGHFGRMAEGDGSFSWEKTDKISIFQNSFGWIKKKNFVIFQYIIELYKMGISPFF